MQNTCNLPFKTFNGLKNSWFYSTVQNMMKLSKITINSKSEYNFIKFSNIMEFNKISNFSKITL